MRIFIGLILVFLVILLSSFFIGEINASPFLRESFDPYELGDTIIVEKDRNLYLYTDAIVSSEEVEIRKESAVSIVSFEIDGRKKEYSIRILDVRTNEIYPIKEIEEKDYVHDGYSPIGQLTLPEGSYAMLVEDLNEENIYRANFQIGTEWRANLGLSLLNVLRIGVRILSVGLIYFLYQNFFTRKKQKWND